MVVVNRIRKTITWWSCCWARCHAAAGRLKKNSKIHCPDLIGVGGRRFIFPLVSKSFPIARETAMGAAPLCLGWRGRVSQRQDRVKGRPSLRPGGVSHRAQCGRQRAARTRVRTSVRASLKTFVSCDLAHILCITWEMVSRGSKKSTPCDIARIGVVGGGVRGVKSVHIGTLC